MNLRKLRGMKVLSLFPLENANGELPAGTVFTIVGKFSGLDLLSEECIECGLRLRIGRVPPHMVGEPYLEK